MSDLLRRIRIELIRYRRYVLAATLALFVWSLLNGAHKGHAILVAGRTIAAGGAITSDDLATAWIDGVDAAQFFQSQEQVIGKTALLTLPSGTPLTAADVELSAQDSGRLVVNLPLESGDGADYPVGSRVHLWALGDEFSTLLTEDAVVIAASSNQVSGARVAVSIPLAAESAAMRASAVRLALVSRGAADG